MVVNTLKNGKREGDPVEVGTMGTGFTMIKRVVFEAMIDSAVTKYTDAIGLSDAENNDMILNCTIDSLPEDIQLRTGVFVDAGANWEALYGQTLVYPLVHVGYLRFYPRHGANPWRKLILK